MFNDWLDVCAGVTVGVLAMALPWLIWATFYGLYQFWSWVGVM